MRNKTYRSVSNYLRLSHRQFYLIDRLAWHSKNLYNVALYNIRQHYCEWQENATYLTGVRPDIVSKVDILIGSFLPYTRSKDFPYKDISNYARTRPNENYSCSTAMLLNKRSKVSKKHTIRSSNSLRCIIAANCQIVPTRPGIWTRMDGTTGVPGRAPADEERP